MRCVDVNILVYAHRPESPDHEAYRTWLDEARTGHEPLGLSDVVLSGFLRVATNHRIFREPTPVAVALDFTDALRASPAALTIQPGERHWSIFTDLCRRLRVAGNLVPDAFLAALVIEAGAEWVTADRGFGRFPGLRWAHPLDG
jgi:toxin-antitoxin system PIN domain toxin